MEADFVVFYGINWGSYSVYKGKDEEDVAVKFLNINTKTEAVRVCKLPNPTEFRRITSIERVTIQYANTR